MTKGLLLEIFTSEHDTLPLPVPPLLRHCITQKAAPCAHKSACAWGLYCRLSP